MTGAIGDARNDLAPYIREATRNNFRWTESRLLGVLRIRLAYAAPRLPLGTQRRSCDVWSFCNAQLFEIASLTKKCFPHLAILVR